MTDTEDHFVANIKVERVRRGMLGPDRKPTRDVVETTNLTVKAKSLTTLKEKVAAHVSLLDEEDL